MSSFGQGAPSFDQGAPSFDQGCAERSGRDAVNSDGATRYCPVCGQALEAPSRATGLTRSSGSRDRHVGDPPFSQGCLNRWCRRPDRGFSVVFSVGIHRDGLRRAITRYKYHRDERLAGVLADSLAGYVDDHATWFEDFDLLASVPSYCGRGARRDWDPLGRIMAAIAERLGATWDVVPDLMSKSAETPAMAGLSWGARQAVARGPLRSALGIPDPGLVDSAKVLVVDDVFTDGSTLREVALALLASGASEVAGLVLARRAWTAAPSVPGLTFDPWTTGW